MATTPSRIHRALVASSLVLVLVLVLVGLDVHAAGVLTAGDLGTQEWFVAHRNPGATLLARTASALGTPVAKTVEVLVVGSVLVLRHRWRRALLLVVATTLTGALTTVTKHLVDTGRPPRFQALAVEASPAFPSGHVTGTVVVYGLLAWFALSTRGRVPAVALAVVLVVLTALSRLYLGVHWLSDVLGGALLGTGVLLLAIAVDVARARATLSASAQRDRPPPADQPAQAPNDPTATPTP